MKLNNDESMVVAADDNWVYYIHNKEKNSSTITGENFAKFVKMGMIDKILEGFSIAKMN